MQQVGIRELKNDASEIIRDVRERQAEYIVTYRGQPVAVILPIDEAMRASESATTIAASRPHRDFWAEWDALGNEIDANWQSDKTAAELITEQRREL